MDATNDKTIEAYETGVNEYIQNAPNSRGAAVEGWIDKALEGLDANAKILEIGSGFGRDAAYVEAKGYHVEKTDTTQAFVDILTENDPTSHRLNIITDSLGTDYDLILANAVLLHLDDSETTSALTKIHDALKKNGTFAFTLKQGEGDAWQENKGMAPRYFNFWQQNDIVKELESAGFEDVQSWIDDTGASAVSWIMIVAKRG